MSHHTDADRLVFDQMLGDAQSPQRVDDPCPVVEHTPTRPTLDRPCKLRRSHKGDHRYE